MWIGALRRTLQGYLADWQGLLRGNVQQAQQILRRLVVGRLKMIPEERGFYRFEGTGTVKPLLSGAVIWRPRRRCHPLRMAKGWRPQRD